MTLRAEDMDLMHHYEHEREHEHELVKHFFLYNIHFMFTVLFLLSQ